MSSYPYLLRQSLDVDTCSEVETPSDLGGRLIGQRRNVNALGVCSFALQSRRKIARSGPTIFPARFEVNKADRSAELS